MMKPITIALCVVFLSHVPVHGATRLRGLRAYGASDETHLPIVLLPAKSITGNFYSSFGDPYVTVDFDVESMIQPQLKLIVVHCSRDWQEDWQHFDDNFMNLQTSDVRGTPAMPQIRGYGYHYVLKCPDPLRRLTLEYSGNYKMKIIEGEDTIGEARFYAVDAFTSVTLHTFNEVDYGIRWHPQVHNVEVDAMFAPDIFSSALEGVDLLVDHRTLDPLRIDPTDTSATVHVDADGPVMRFIKFNVLPGNAYRSIDISDPRVFPPSTIPIALVPRDLIRTGLIETADMHGSSILNYTNPEDAEYLPIRFRLDAMGQRDRDIFLVGPFNNWQVQSEYQMDYSPREHNYSRVVWLKRGVHEYQYVTGMIDPKTHDIVDQSWTELEANGWTTQRQYTALIYYRDTRYGGIDRIVGCGKNL